MVKVRSVRASAESPAFELKGEIVEGTVKALKTFLQQNVDEPKLRIRIESPGGDAGAGFEMYRLLEDFPGKVFTVAVGAVASAAVAVFAGGSSRKMYPDSSLHLHMGRLSGSISKREYAKAENQEGLTNANTRFAGIISTATGVPAETVIEWMVNEKSFTPQEAVESGLATQVLGGDEPAGGGPTAKGAKSLTELIASNNRSASSKPYAGNPKPPARAVNRSAGKPQSLVEMVKELNRR